MRVRIAERTEIDLGAAPEFLDGAGSGCQICTVIISLLLGALAELFLVSLQSESAAALVCLILEQIQNAGLHLADFEHNSLTAFVVLITVETTHSNILLSSSYAGGLSAGPGIGFIN
jgi:hypothetical protein